VELRKKQKLQFYPKKRVSTKKILECSRPLECLCTSLIRSWKTWGKKTGGNSGAKGQVYNTRLLGEKDSLSVALKDGWIPFEGKRRNYFKTGKRRDKPMENGGQVGLRIILKDQLLVQSRKLKGSEYL